MHDSPLTPKQFLNSFFKTNAMVYLEDDILTSLFYKEEWSNLLFTNQLKEITESDVDSRDKLHLLFLKIDESNNSKANKPLDDDFQWQFESGGNFLVPTYFQDRSLDYNDVLIEIMAANIAIELNKIAQYQNWDEYSKYYPEAYSRHFFRMDKLLFLSIEHIYKKRNSKSFDFFKELKSYTDTINSNFKQDDVFHKNWIDRAEKFFKIIEAIIFKTFTIAFSKFYGNYRDVSYAFPYHLYYADSENLKKVMNQAIEIIEKDLVQKFLDEENIPMNIIFEAEAESERVFKEKFGGDISGLKRIESDNYLNISLSNAQLFRRAEDQAYKKYYFWLKYVSNDSDEKIYTKLSRQDIINFVHLMVGVGFFKTRHEAFTFFSKYFMIRDSRTGKSKYIKIDNNNLFGKPSVAFKEILKNISPDNQ